MADLPAASVRTAARGASLRMVCFRLHGQLYAVPVDRVAEVVTYRPVTRVPFVPSWVAGIINLRGDVVTVVDLGDFLGLGKTAPTDATRIVIVRAAQRIGGVLVDRIDEMRTVDEAKIEPSPPVRSSHGAAVLTGVVTLGEKDQAAGAPVMVLDMDRVFGSAELVAT
jgi:purine-binding chemotaxis protein CheW